MQLDRSFPALEKKLKKTPVKPNPIREMHTHCQKHFSTFQKFLVDDSGSNKEIWQFSEEAPADRVQ